MNLDTSEQTAINNEDENVTDDARAIEDIPSSSTNQPRLGNLGEWEKHTKVSNIISLVTECFLFIYYIQPSAPMVRKRQHVVITIVRFRVSFEGRKYDC